MKYSKNVKKILSKKKVILNKINKKVRPFTNKLVNSIFSIINNKIHGSNILELFSGIALCSFKSLLKGAKSICIVDNNKNTIKLLHISITKSKIKNNLILYCADVIDIIKKKIQRQYKI